ncbi:MAG: CopG family transcriptional regulator [Acidimicrobiales bacterium]|nr:MAG: CopG family transcriptional regulator [Acidimicrobiales bacterium]
MADNGIEVRLEEDPDRRRRRLDWGIPDELASCHTALVAGYVVEGHVPIQAMERLLTNRREAVGLSVPGMPGDSPGMGGDEASWSSQIVFAIAVDGSFRQFDY